MRIIIISFCIFILSSCAGFAQGKSGNPIFQGWYADPEGAVFNNTFWVYPTYSAPYDKQVFFDAFSSNDLVHWTKHSHITDTSKIKWAHRAMWAPAIVEKEKKILFLFWRK
jgi:beta-xylosidase